MELAGDTMVGATLSLYGMETVSNSMAVALRHALATSTRLAATLVWRLWLIV